MIYFAEGSEKKFFTYDELRTSLYKAFDSIGTRQKILAIPPDITRYHSKAGEITSMAYNYYREKLTDILPALGTHFPMTEAEIEKMFKGVPKNLFREHKWKEDLTTLGIVPSEFIFEVSEGKLNYDWPAQVNKLLLKGNYDLILSVGQVVPHEVVGMANYNKNIFVGVGGKDGINKSHFLGAVYGMERMMGRANTPVRKVLNYASDNFAANLPIVYVLTVIGKMENGEHVVRGLFIGDDFQAFQLAADLSLKVNFTMLEKPLRKVIAYLDPSEFKSAWLGNKAVYRTRMAIEDGGELIILAPGLKEFGEDKEIDSLIRKYGYLTSEEILALTDKNNDLKKNLSAAAHLIHGSSEKRFKITYAPGSISKSEIESVGYNYMDLNEALKKYDPAKLKDGYNFTEDGEEIFFISNPALGLWSHRDKFK